MLNKLWDNLTSVDLNASECEALFSQIESKLINTPNSNLKNQELISIL